MQRNFLTLVHNVESATAFHSTIYTQAKVAVGPCLSRWAEVQSSLFTVYLEILLPRSLVTGSLVLLREVTSLALPCPLHQVGLQKAKQLFAIQHCYKVALIPMRNTFPSSHKALYLPSMRSDTSCLQGMFTAIISLLCCSHPLQGRSKVGDGHCKHSKNVCHGLCRKNLPWEQEASLWVSINLPHRWVAQETWPETWHCSCFRVPAETGHNTDEQTLWHCLPPTMCTCNHLQIKAAACTTSENSLKLDHSKCYTTL